MSIADVIKKQLNPPPVDLASLFGKPFPSGNLTKKKGISKGLGFQSQLLHGLTGETAGGRGEVRDVLFPGLSEYATGEGYSPEEQSAILQSGLGALNTRMRGVRDQMQNRQARTGNLAGYGSFLSELGREEGRQGSELTRRSTIDFADEKFRRRMAGLEGLARMYGIDTSFLNSLLGHQSDVLSIGRGVESGRRGVLGNIGAGLKMAGGALGGIFGFEEGGYPPENELSVVGESGPELILPRGPVEVIPLSRRLYAG